MSELLAKFGFNEEWEATRPLSKEEATLLLEEFHEYLHKKADEARTKAFELGRTLGSI